MAITRGFGAFRSKNGMMRKCSAANPNKVPEPSEPELVRTDEPAAFAKVRRNFVQPEVADVPSEVAGPSAPAILPGECSREGGSPSPWAAGESPASDRIVRTAVDTLRTWATTRSWSPRWAATAAAPPKASAMLAEFGVTEARSAARSAARWTPSPWDQLLRPAHPL